MYFKGNNVMIQGRNQKVHLNFINNSVKLNRKTDNVTLSYQYVGEKESEMFVVWGRDPIIDTCKTLNLCR